MGSRYSLTWRKFRSFQLKFRQILRGPWMSEPTYTPVTSYEEEEQMREIIRAL